MSSSSDGSEFKTDITADPSKFEQGVKAAATAAAGASDQINAQFKKIGDVVARLNNALVGMFAVIAGGGALKKFIGDANEWNASAGKMASQLGISTEKASVLNTALARLGIESDVYLGAAQRLSKQVQGNGEAFAKLGINVRDTSGAYKPVTELMGEVNAKLLAIKNPIEQNIAGQQVYGKGWQEVRGILRLTSEQMQASEVRARQLGLIVGPEGVAASKQYTAQMRDLGLVGKSIEVQFGNALLPVFVKTGAWLGKEGPQMGEVFSKVLLTISAAAQMTWKVIVGLGDTLAAAAAQAALIMRGDIKGAMAVGEEWLAKQKQMAADFRGIWANAYTAPTMQPLAADPDTSAGPKYHFGKEGAAKADPKSRMGDWDAALDTAKAAIAQQGLLEGQYRERSLADNLAYWQTLSQRNDLTHAERVGIARKTAEAEMAIAKQKFDVDVATLQAEAAQWKNNMDERLRLEQETQAKYQRGTKEWEESEKRIADIKRQAAAQDRAVAQARVEIERSSGLAQLQLQEQALQQDAELGLVSNAQRLEKLREFESARYDIARQAIEDRLQLALLDPDRNPAEVERINGELQALEQQHQLKMQAIRGAMRNDGLQPLVNVYQAGEAAIARSIEGVLRRTMTLKQGLTAAWQGISSAIISELSKYLAKKLAVFAVEKTLALAGIATKAASAGAGAAEAESSIPYVGPVLALAAMAAVFAAVMGMQSSVPSASAAGGFDIPGTLAPIVQTHPREMILPSTIADVIRSRVGDESSGGGARETIHLHGSPDDTVKLRDLASHLRRLDRDFAWHPRR